MYLAASINRKKKGEKDRHTNRKKYKKRKYTYRTKNVKNWQRTN